MDRPRIDQPCMDHPCMDQPHFDQAHIHAHFHPHFHHHHSHFFVSLVPQVVSLIVVSPQVVSFQFQVVSSQVLVSPEVLVSVSVVHHVLLSFVSQVVLSVVQ